MLTALQTSYSLLVIYKTTVCCQGFFHILGPSILCSHVRLHDHRTGCLICTASWRHQAKTSPIVKCIGINWTTTKDQAVAAGFSLRKDEYLNRDLKVAATIHYNSVNVSTRRRGGRSLPCAFPEKCRGDALSSPVIIPPYRRILPQGGISMYRKTLAFHNLFSQSLLPMEV